MATNGKRNRSAGHGAELEIIKEVRARKIHPHAVSTRSVNRKRDDQGIDLSNEDESEHGRMQDDMQVKSCCTCVPYPKLLDVLRNDKGRMPVVLHKQTQKAGTRFMTKDWFAITYKDTYMDLLATREAFNSVKPFIHLLPVPVQERLRELGLY